MSILIDMMPRTKLAPELAERLERLTGEDADCCSLEYRALAADVRKAPAFAPGLARLKALADEKRLLAASILKRKGELCGCELQAALGLTHATISHHMSVLADAGVVTSERRGKWIHYSLNPDIAPLVP